MVEFVIGSWFLNIHRTFSSSRVKIVGNTLLTRKQLSADTENAKYYSFVREKKFPWSYWVIYRIRDVIIQQLYLFDFQLSIAKSTVIISVGQNIPHGDLEIDGSRKQDVLSIPSVNGQPLSNRKTVLKMTRNITRTNLLFWRIATTAKF